MARNNAKTERVGFSDYEFDKFNDFDLGGFEDTAPVKNDRNPAAVVAGRFVKGSSEALQNQDFQRNIIKHALPDGYLRTYDAARDAKSVLDDIRYEARTGLDNLVDTTKRTIQPLTNKLDRVLPKEMAGKVKDWSKSTRDSQGYGRYDPGEYQRAEMQDTLREIFGGWEAVKNDINRDRSNQTLTTDTAIDAYNDDVQQKLQATSNEELGQIRVMMERAQDYNNRVSHRFREKSLEVAYKTMWSVSTIADLTKQNLEQQKAANDRIVKNTALPEVVKIHNSELAWQLMKERSFGGIVDNVGNTFDNMRRKLVERTRKEVNSFFREAVGTVSTVGMFAQGSATDDWDDYDPMESEEDRRNRKKKEELTNLAGSAAEMAGGTIAKKYGRKVGNWIKGKYGDNPEVSRVGLALSNFLDSAPTYLNDALDRRKKSGNEAFDYIRNMLGLDQLRYKEETSVRKSSLADLDQMATFNVRTQRTINEIIPGWLSRIHNEIRMHRTGTDDLDPMRWSFESNTFEDTTDSMKRLRNQIFNRDTMSRTSNDLDSVIAEIDPDGKLSNSARAKLRDYLIEIVYSPDKRVTMETLVGNDSALDEATRKELAALRAELTDEDISAFDSSVSGGIRSDFSGSGAAQSRRARILAAMENARSGIPTNVRDIIARAKGGDMDILSKAGLLKQNEKGEWHYSNDSLKSELHKYDDMVGPRSPFRRGFASGGASGTREDLPGDSLFVKQIKGHLRKLTPEQLQATVEYVQAQRQSRNGVRAHHGPYKKFVSIVPKDFVAFLESNRGMWNASIFPLIEEFAAAPDGINTVDLRDGIPANNRSGQGGPSGTGMLSKITGVTHAHEHVIRAKSAMEPGAREFLNNFNSMGMKALGQEDGPMSKIRDAVNGASPLDKTNELLKGVQIAVSDMAMNGVSIDPNPDVRARQRRFTKALVKKHFNAKDILSPSFIVGTIATGGGYAVGDLSYRGYKFAKDYAKREALNNSDAGLEMLEHLTSGMQHKHPMLRKLLLSSAHGASKVARNRQEFAETIGERQGEMVDKILDRIEARKAKAEGKDDTRNTTDKDGDGLRDNSWQEDKAKKAAIAAAGGNAQTIVPAPQIAKKGGMLGLLTSLVTMIGTFIPGAMAWGSRIMGWGGTALNLLRTIATGKAAGSIAGGIGDFIGGRGRGRAGKLGRMARKAGVAGKVLGLAGLAGGGYALSQMGAADTTEKVNVGYGISREFDIPEEEQAQSWTDKALDWGGTALTVGSVASLANMATGGAVYAGLGALGTAAAGLLTAPVLIGAAAVAAVGYGGYLLYKKLKSDSSYCLNFRLAQYGFSYKNDDASSNVIAMEEYLLKHISVSKDKPAVIARTANILELLKIFKIDSKDKEAVSRFIHWMQRRFKPVFLGAVTTYFRLANSKELSKADSFLKPEQKAEYISQSDIAMSGANGVYDDMANPMPRAKVLQMDGKAVSDYKAVALAKLEKSSTKESKASEHKREIQAKKDSAGKLAKDGTAGTTWQDETKARADDRRNSLREAISSGWNNFKEANSKLYDSTIGVVANTIGQAWDETIAGPLEKLTGKAKDNQLSVYKAFRSAGLNDNQAKIATAEVGRENDYQSRYLFGGHNDPANGKYNLGFISWQGDRGKNLYNFLKGKGLIDSSNKIPQSQEALNAQAQFMVNEIKTIPSYSATKASFLDNPGVDYDTGTRVLGKNYIRWRYDDPRYQSHHKRRNNHYANLLQQLKDNPSAAKPTAPAPKNGAGSKVNQGIMAPGANQAAFGNNPLAQGSIKVPSGGFAGAAGPSRNVPAASNTGAQTGMTVPSPVKGGYTVTSNISAGNAARSLDPVMIAHGKKMAVRQDANVDLNGMNQDFMKFVYALIGEWSKANGGKKVIITSAFRSKEKQYQLWYKYKYHGGTLAAYPGKSKHEFGIAIDIDKSVANSMAGQGLLSKYGFTRPLLNHPKFPEAWHLEHKLFGKPGETMKAVEKAEKAVPKAEDGKKKTDADKKVANKASPAILNNSEISPIGKGSNGQPMPQPKVSSDAASVGNRSAAIASGGQYSTPTAPTPRPGGDRNTVPTNVNEVAKQQLEVMNSMNGNLVKIADTLVRMEKNGGLSKPVDDANATAAKIADSITKSLGTAMSGQNKSMELRPPVNLKS